MYQKILFTEPGVAKLCEDTLTDPQDHEVQVKLVVSSISSGTERANLLGNRNVSPHCGETDPVFPRSGGYSSSGIVTAVGKNVSDLTPGDRVALSWSSHSQVLKIDRNLVYPLNDHVSFEDAALFHIAIFPLAAIRKCHVEPGESVLVMGMGVLGLTALQLLRQTGAVPIIAADPIPEKRAKALECGADYALDPYAEDFSAKVLQLTGGGANAAIEVTGVGKALDSVLDCMAKFGRVALLGCTRNSDFTIDYYRKVHGPGITLVGAHTDARPQSESSFGWWTQKDDVETIHRLTAFHRLHLSSLVDETHSPLEAETIYQRLATEKSFPMVQFDWRKLT